jgi:hypothetical protein
VLGLALCFDLNAASFEAVMLSLALMSSAQMFPGERESREKGQIRAGLSYVRSEPELLIPLLMVAVIGALAWEFPISLPLVARSTFHGGAGTYGVMTAVMGAGAVAGGLITASRKRVRRRGLAIAAIGWGVAITGSACPQPAAGVRRAGLRRLRQHLVQCPGQDGAAAVVRVGDARPRDGAVGRRLAGLDPNRRAARGLWSGRSSEPGGL